MTSDRNHLQAARSQLETAAKTASDDAHRETLQDAAAAMANFSASDRQPDHAVFDRHLNELRQVSEDASDDLESQVENAIDHAERYREGLEQA